MPFVCVFTLFLPGSPESTPIPAPAMIRTASAVRIDSAAESSSVFHRHASEQISAGAKSIRCSEARVHQIEDQRKKICFMRLILRCLLLFLIWGTCYKEHVSNTRSRIGRNR